MKMEERALEEIAKRVRENVVKMIWEAGGGHIGGSLSMVDILAVLYFRIIKTRPNQPQWEDRDRLVLSKGHGAAALYAILAEKGFFSEEVLFTSFIKVNGMLQEHPDMSLTPGVDMTTGSLGQGLSIAAGMAWGLRQGSKKCLVYTIIGCGEVQEGQVWEAAMASSHYKLSNLIAIIDYNKLQVCGPTKEVMNVEPLVDKWKAFGWRVVEVNGHDLRQLENVLREATVLAGTIFQPSVIIAHTVKGKGVSFLENNYSSHALTLKEEDFLRAMEELEKIKR